MQEVEKGIRVALSLNRCDGDPDAWEDERRELEEEIASLKAQQCRRSEDTTDIIVERDMWKKMYEKALEMLVTKNINTASEAVVVEEPKPKTEPRVEFVTEPEVTADINTASEADLRKCGCTPDMSRRIVENRPYKAVDDLKKFDWMTRIGFQIVKNRLTCEVVVEEPPKQDKININIVSAKELDEAIHCGMTIAYSITGYRKRNGYFTDLEKLREVKYVPKSFLEKYGEKLTVGEV
jgi:DNA uptake protein ComE-like DNA-binding protein